MSNLIVQLRSTQYVDSMVPRYNKVGGIKNITFVFVIGYEKRDLIVQNAIFCNFSSCYHFKVSRAPGFRDITGWLVLRARGL